MIPRTEEMTKNGMSILRISKAPIRKGLNTVVNRYTLSKEKLLRDATLPVPKNATFTKNINRTAALPSLGLSARTTEYRLYL